MRTDRNQRRAVVWLNVALLAALAAVTLTPAASGQRAQRARGDFAMVSGPVQGLSAEGVYLIDARNGEAAAFYWDQSRRTLQTMGYRDIARDIEQARGGAR